MTVAAPPQSPYRGLAPFGDSDLDALLFFGRERERRVIAANVMASRLTVLYGPTGVGKTSVLRAGVAREVRALAPEAAVAVFSSWRDDPVPALCEAVGEPADGSLADALERAAARLGGDVYLVLDQLEEYFLYHGDHGPLGDELAEVLRRRLPVNVLLSIREDALARLDAFKTRVPGLFANTLRLDQLDREAGRAAIVGPLGAWGRMGGEAVAIEPELVEAVLDEVAAGRIEAGLAGRGAVEANGGRPRVEAPYLQLVMQRLWEAERARGSAVLRLETLRSLGGAARIVERQLEDALAGLPADEQDVAARMFEHLVTPSGTKIAHSSADLGEFAHVPRDVLAGVLDRLADERILRPLADGGREERYEIFHDVLAGAVLAWRARHEAAREAERERRAAVRRHRIALAVAAAAVAALAVVAAVAVYALAQRGDAREQARVAHGRELAALALGQLASDPELALLLAVEAARLDPGPRAEDALREALLASRVRSVRKGTPAPPARRVSSPDGSRLLVLNGRGTVAVRDASGRVVYTLRQPSALTAAAFGRGGRLLATGGADGTARIWNAETGALRHVLRGHVGRILAIAFSPRGALVATASTDGTARVWRASTGALVAPLVGHGNYVVDVAFRPDGFAVATASTDMTARVWKANTGATLAVLAGHRQAVRSVAFSRDGRTVVTSSDDGTTRTWDAVAQPELALLARLPKPLRSASYAAGGRVRVVARDGTAWTLDARTGRVVATGRAPAAAPGRLRIEGKTVVVDRKTVLRGHEDAVTSARLSRDGALVVTASRDHDARVWDAATGRLLRVLRGHFAVVSDASFSPDGRWVVTAGPGTAGLWQVASGRLVLYLRGHEGILVSAGFDASGRRIVTAGADRTVRVYACEVCGGLDALVRVAQARLARTGRAPSADERARFGL